MATSVQAPDSWFAYRKPRSTIPSLRIFCFPYAGGGAAVFRRWNSGLPEDIEVWPVQPPGRETRIAETPFRDMLAFTASVADALRPHLDVPFAFFGHSMGAAVAFDLARRLRRRGWAQPTFLFLSARRPPHLPDKNRLRYDLSDAEFMAELRRLGGTPKAALESPELLELLVPVLRADCQVCDTYLYAEEPPLDCPIAAYYGEGDVDTPLEDMEQWRIHTNRSFALRGFAGDHFFLTAAESEVLAAICSDVEQSRLLVPTA